MNKVVLAAAAFLGAPLTVHGQSALDEEQELLEAIRRCNDGWVASMEQEDFEVFANACPHEPDGLFWYTFTEAPVTYGGPDGWWQSSFEASGLSWKDLRLVDLRIHDDWAFVHYTVTWIIEDAEGEATPNPSRRLTAFRHQNGQWVMVGGSVSGLE